MVTTMFKMPETPEARNADSVEDKPACEKRTGAYFFKAKLRLYSVCV
jgi:hypothetical protein